VSSHRPSTLDSGLSTILALDIGGTKLAVGVARRDEFQATGRLAAIAKEAVPAPGTPEVVIARVIEIARELLRADGGRLDAIGISIGGPLDHITGTVINFPHLPGWKMIPLCREISQALEAPAALDNDANLGALAESRLGAGRGVDDLVYLTISTGIGGGVILGGRLLHGVGSGAGEVGHITVESRGPLCPCGNRGCLEIMASGTSIARRARALAELDRSRGERLIDHAGGDIAAITSEHVVSAMIEGDPVAAQIWEETAGFIAIGLGSIIHILAPSMIILGGGVAQTGELLLEPVRRRLRDHVFYIPLDRISLVSAALGHDSALLGAACLAAAGEWESGRGE
jgi:glucokinase